MVVFASVCLVVVTVLWLLLEAGQLARTTTSLYELRRLKTAKDTRAAVALRREELVAQAGALKAPLRGLLIVAAVFLLLYLFGWAKGVGIAVLAVLLVARISRVAAVRKLANRFYARREDSVLRLIDKHEGKVRFIGGKASLSQPTAPLSSREELLHLLEVSHIFSAEDKSMLTSTLDFSNKIVRDVMIKKSAMVTVKPNELLGPLVLDDLHKTKHEIFPVEKNGEILGMLDIRDHVALRRKESVQARDVMHAGVVRINQSEPLDEALRVLVAAKQPYLIVIDDDGHVVGMLGMGDVIRTLTGWTRR